MLHELREKAELHFPQCRAPVTCLYPAGVSVFVELGVVGVPAASIMVILVFLLMMMAVLPP